MSLDGITEEDAQLRQWLLNEAEERGNAVVQVPQDEYGAPYCFSVGAWRRFGVPEAVVVGLPEDMGPVLVNAYVARARSGERFRPGRLYDDFFDGVPVAVERVAKGHYPQFLGSAFLLYRTGDFPAVQLITPTPDGAWPWQQQAPDGFAAWQPVLTESGVPESWTPGVDGP
ncbi:MAG: DUF4262 domain-containing protein [Pseudonocardiaceae bacterium]|nr:DUF4262 domain-containing protein [Pseudonocardiaceae bacterium]